LLKNLPLPSPKARDRKIGVNFADAEFLAVIQNSTERGMLQNLSEPLSARICKMDSAEEPYEPGRGGALQGTLNPAHTHARQHKA
jgi:hypothetical protein